MSAPSTRVIRPCTVVTGSASEVPCESTGFVAWAVARGVRVGAGVPPVRAPLPNRWHLEVGGSCLQ